MNDGTSLKSVKQIRRTEYPEYNLGNIRTAKLKHEMYLYNKNVINIVKLKKFPVTSTTGQNGLSIVIVNKMSKF